MNKKAKIMNKEKELQKKIDNFFCPRYGLAENCLIVHVKDTRIAELEGKLNEVGEAITVLCMLNKLYKLSTDMRAEPTQSAARLMIQQSEEGIRRAQSRRKDEYIEKQNKTIAELEADYAHVEALLKVQVDRVAELELELEKHKEQD
jgi:hypothetical protein